MFKHEDDRRSLIELTNGEYRACKVVVAKRDCVVGLHHHKKKDEVFLLAHGWAIVAIGCHDKGRRFDAPAEFVVPRGEYHSFGLSKGSILVGVMTETYDSADDFPWPKETEDKGY